MAVVVEAAAAAAAASTAVVSMIAELGVSKLLNEVFSVSSEQSELA